MKYIIGTLAIGLLFCACSNPSKEVPDKFSDLQTKATIYPDYTDVVLPPNIAPLNFMVRDPEATAFVATITATDDAVLAAGGTENGKIMFDTLEWRQLIQSHKGQTLEVAVYAQHANGWVRYVPHHLTVAEEDIDPYLSYRLIEPGYELYRQLGLYQRNLTNFTQEVIYENNRTFDDDENHCINCHNYQNYDAENALFHVRAAHGGTVIIQGDKAHKIGIKCDSILGAGVYPSWHPTLPLIAFSSNKTGQVFHMYHPEKIEVLDEKSDLILYDVEKNEVCNIIRSTDHMESFPCWSPDGKRLFYISAKTPQLSEENFEIDLLGKYDSLLYNVYSMPFDIQTRTFGEPQLEVEATAFGGSASVPRISPDGRYLLFTMGTYGQFHIWHRGADIWVKDLQADNATSATDSTVIFPLTAANSSEADSYHTWSSNGRWIVFSTRRDDANYTRPYIAYFDREGRAHKAFMLPQEDPEHSILLLKSYNVPELTRTPLRISRTAINDAVLHTEADNAKYKE